MRPRRLLVHKREIRHLHSKVQLDGYAIIPLSVYLKNSRVKLEIALCRGKSSTTSGRLPQIKMRADRLSAP